MCRRGIAHGPRNCSSEWPAASARRARPWRREPPRPAVRPAGLLRPGGSSPRAASAVPASFAPPPARTLPLCPLQRSRVDLRLSPSRETMGGAVRPCSNGWQAIPRTCSRPGRARDERLSRRRSGLEPSPISLTEIPRPPQPRTPRTILPRVLSRPRAPPSRWLNGGLSAPPRPVAGTRPARRRMPAAAGNTIRATRQLRPSEVPR